MNIIRFNWHFYTLSFLLFIVLYLLGFTLEGKLLMRIISVCNYFLLYTIIASLGVSYYIYDLSDLYKLKWIEIDNTIAYSTLLNITAGFDETSLLIKQKFPKNDLNVCDFYDPSRHTEISIRRARKAYPTHEGTFSVNTSALPFPNSSVDLICVIFSAHEIRNGEERAIFFKEMERILKPRGRIIITEHLRDIPNFLAYNIGFFHFYSFKSWMKTIECSNLILHQTVKTTPFISTFILKKHGSTS